MARGHVLHWKRLRVFEQYLKSAAKMVGSVLDVLLIIVLVSSAMIFVASLWNIDWALWRHDFYLYYPPWFWHVRASETFGLGFWVNVQYFQLAASYVASTVATYMIGRRWCACRT